WVQALPWWGFRGAILIALTTGLAVVLAVKVGFRLFREFGDRSLALLLERRYPDVLGDRLMTAVELADPALARRYNYSQVMIEETIRDAAERLERLPIAPVFDYRRLWRQGLYVAGLSLGVFAVVGVVPLLRTGMGGGEF